MRLLGTVLLCCTVGLLAVNVEAQQLVSKTIDKQLLPQPAPVVTLGEALAKLEQAYDVHIVYDDAVVAGRTAPLWASTSGNFQEALEFVLGRNPITYRKVGARTIVLQPMEPAPPVAPRPAGGTIKGRITDEFGEPLPLAQVVIAGTTIGDAADDEGQYVIENVPPGAYTVQVRYIGYKGSSAEITISGDETITQDFSLSPDILDMAEVVTTATRNPASKRESSVAITTLSPKRIEEAAPRSTADLLKAIPGFYVESSGGEVGGNLFARGMPADGSFRYVALMEEGMPVYDSTELFFINADIFVRVDANIERVEAVRGGNAALFGSNAPGGVINFISKTGGPITNGTVKAQGGTAGLARYDFNINGPLAENWFFSVGGFYRFDGGVRDPGYPGSRGGQLKINLSRVFEKGYFKVYGKYLNDANIFYLPVPFKAGKDLDFVEGFPEDGTLTTEEANLLRVPFPNLSGEIAGEFEMPLEDGQKQTGGSLIADFGFELPNDWTIQNTARVMSVDQSWNAVVPFSLTSFSDRRASLLADTPGAASVNFAFVNHEGDPEAASRNGLLLDAGLWHVSKPLSDFSNQLQVQKKYQGHTFTFGTYFGHYTADNFWYWQDVLLDVRDRPRMIDVTVNDAAGNVIRRVTDNGFRQYGSLYVNGEGNVSITSVFGGADIQASERVKVDVGLRYEHDTFKQNSEKTGSFDLAGGVTDAHTGVAWGLGTFTRGTHSFDEWAASGGLNYLVNENVSVYGRVSRGYKMPILDNYLFGPGADLEAEQIIQGEVGLKLGTPKFGLNAVAYALQIKDFPSQDAQVDPVTGETVFVTVFAGKARTFGAEIEAVAAPVQGLRLNGTFTLQDPEYTDFVSEGGQDFSGNSIRRIPKIITDLSLSYSREGFNGVIDWKFVGKRYSNNANTIELPKFGVVNLGASYVFKGGVGIGFNLLNVLDGHGLTEGNPRLDESSAAAGEVFLARPILPRRFVGYVSYSF